MTSSLALGESLIASLALVGMLGFRHGFDADHIAVVDGMTRARQLHHSYWTSRLVGLQFAFGHSATILIASLLLVGQSAALPSWLEGLGLMISIGFLLVIAATNLNHALRKASPVERPLGPLAAALMRLTGRNLHPALVGVAFAMSFDSMAQAAFFASRGSASDGVTVVVLLACAFGLGMMLADAANGALLNWFASRSDQLARQASRFSSGFIAVLALLTASAAMAREFQDGFARAWEGLGIWVGVGLMAFTSLVFLARITLQRMRLRATAAPR